MKYLELKDNLRYFDNDVAVALAEMLLSEFQDFAYRCGATEEAVESLQGILDEFELRYEVYEDSIDDDFDELQDDFESLTPDEFLDKYL